jgi:hypothetical protein
MGRKVMDLSEAVAGSLLEQVGPRKFAIAVMNATAHGGVLHDCHTVDLDFDQDDVKLNAWHEQLERLLEVGKWLEHVDGKTPEFLRHKVRPDDEFSDSDQRDVADLSVDDQTVQQIVTLENIVFELSGHKIRILRKNSAKTSVILRGGLVWFVDAVRDQLSSDSELYDVFKFVARCIAEDRVKVTHENWEFTCTADGRLNKQRKHKGDDGSDGFEISIDDLGELIEDRLGVHFDIVVGEANEDLIVEMVCPRSKFIETLDNYVERVRSVGYVADSLFDLYGLIVKLPCVRNRHVGGPGSAPISSRVARRRLEALS